MKYLVEDDNYKLCDICIYINENLNSCKKGFKPRRYQSKISGQIYLQKKNCKEFKLCDIKRRIIWLV